MDTADKVNILMVDDQPAKLLAYEAMLGELGENLIKATSANEALEILLQDEVTVVLMDVSMPDVDGFELAALIRAHPRFEKTAIIFVSGVYLSDVDKVKGYASGAVDYVSVPVVPEILRAKVRVFTELYRRKRDVDRLNRELEERVAERTADLEASTAKQVELTNQLLEADKRKDEFLALLGHELRNPLAPLRNAIAIMRMKQHADPEVKWSCDLIERQTEQLTRLVDDLLDVSRISQGKIKLRSETIDLRSVVQAAVETSRPIIDLRRHELTVSLPEEPLRLTADPARLSQIIANLLINAAKFQEPGGRITISVARNGGNAEIRVRDRGIGIDAERIGSVFDLFAQGGHAPDLAPGGLGVGLSLVKKLVEMHGGTVDVASEGAGRGAEFIVRLPYLDGTRAEQDKAVAGTSLGGEQAVPRKILIVEDNHDVAESLATLLTLMGNEVRVAHDGQSALEMASETRPSLLLLDIGLPGMDGYEVCRAARARGFDDVQIIAMTGFGQESDRQRAMDAGFDAFASKPVRVDQLMELINAPRRNTKAEHP
jgi:signal transduction histidine kinase